MNYLPCDRYTEHVIVDGKCFMCGKSKEELEIKNFVCSKCGEKFHKQSELRIHFILRHTMVNDERKDF